MNALCYFGNPPKVYSVEGSSKNNWFDKVQNENTYFYPSLPPSAIENNTTLLWKCNCGKKLFSSIAIKNNKTNKNKLWILHACSPTLESQLKLYYGNATPRKPKRTLTTTDL